MNSRVISLLLIFTALLVTVPTFASPTDGENVGKVSVPDGYVPEGPFYWTRGYWKWTNDIVKDGHATIVKSDGSERTRNIFGVIGYKATGKVAHFLKREGWNFLNDYWSGQDLRQDFKDKEYWDEKKDRPFFRGEGETFWGYLKRFITKPISHIWNSMKDLGEAAQANWNDMYEVDKQTGEKELKFGELGPLAAPFVFAWNNIPTVFDAVWIMGIELPVRVTFGTAYRVLYPFYPVLTASTLWFVGEPVNLALNGGLSLGAAAVGTVGVATMMGFESIKFIAWDSWHMPDGEDIALAKTKSGEVVGIYKVPNHPMLDTEIERVLSQAQSVQEIQADFDHLLTWMDKDNSWLTLSHITQKLSQTEIALDRELVTALGEKHEAISLEKEAISNLKEQYGLSLKEALQEKYDTGLAMTY